MDTELTAWQRLLELAYPLTHELAGDGREAVVDVLQFLRDRGHVNDQALEAAVNAVAQDRGLV